MLKTTSALMLLSFVFLALATPVNAQAPTGTILGSVTDASGAAIPDAAVTVTNKATGFSRSLTTNTAGLYSAPALPAGEYEVRVEAKGFRTIVRQATVETGTITTADIPMEVGGTKEVVQVEAATAQINYESHAVEGVIDRQDIENLPLNGRSFMQLAALEPGVTISPGSTAQFNSLFTVSILGSGQFGSAGGMTIFNIDGGSITDQIEAGQSSMNFSQESVQEFQLTEFNFDIATGVTSAGSINVVTRSGSNDFHGSAYFFFRDHNMAAYPALQRSALNPNPFFARRNPGFWLGGPIVKDKFFFFFNFEHINQVQAQAVQPNLPSLSTLTGVFGSPYVGKTLSARFDYHISTKNTLFARYSHDGNTGFGDVFSNGDPSNWVHNINWADQSIVGLTSILTPSLVNDLRAQYNYWRNKNLQAVPADCQLPCVGGTLPSLVTVAGSNFGLGGAAIGPNFNAPQARQTRRYQIIDNLNWQKGTHRFKFGFDINRAISDGLWGFCTPFCTAAFSEEYVQGLLGPYTPYLFPNLVIPGTNQLRPVTNDAGFLNLPVLNLATDIYSGVPVGSSSTPAPYDFNQNKPNSQYHEYFQDTWRVRPNLTLNYGLGLITQRGFYNSDLKKPQFLAPLLGANNLGATPNNNHEFQPALGFAWSPGKSGKTVIRGGAGIYWDQTPGYYKLREPASIGPVGDGRTTLGASILKNTLPGIFVITANGPVPLPVGAPIPLYALTTMTLGQFDQIVNQQLPSIQATLTPPPPKSGPYTTSGIDLSKQGVQIFPSNNPNPRSYQTTIGIQQDLGHDMVLTADFARRVAVNVDLGQGRDLNHAAYYVNGTPSPVIPFCTGAPGSQVFVPGDECSSGGITVWEDQGRSVFNGLLMKVQKRFSHRYSFIASYGLQSLDSNNCCTNELNWFASYGPTIPRQTLNVAGIVQLPWGFQLSVNNQWQSRTPQEAFIPGIALPGVDVAAGSAQTLPGLPFNCLGFSCGKSDLAKAVANFNSTWAGKTDSIGNLINPIFLPSDYQFGDPTFATDFRLTKEFAFRERYKLSIFGEMFNAFNISNLGSYAFNLDTGSIDPTTHKFIPPSSFTFGQPSIRQAQTFGSAGPRAVQVGGRFTF